MQKRRWSVRNPAADRAARSAKRTVLLLSLLLLVSSITAACFGLRTLVTDLAVSAAQDAVTLAVNSIVKDIMADPSFDPTGLVSLERSSDGAVTAVTTNVAAVNMLSAEVLERAVAKTGENKLTVHVPLGSLLGSTFFTNKGPSIPVEVVMLSSSTAGFRSDLTGAGINQTRHRILLDLHVAVSLFMPWRSVGTSADTEILVSETIIVGDVPQSYMNWEN